MRITVGAAALLVQMSALLPAGRLAAQTDQFDGAYAAFQGAPATERTALANEVLTAFLRIPLGDPGREPRQERAGICAVVAGRPEVGLELLESLGRDPGPDGAQWRLRALFRLGRSDQALDCMRREPFAVAAAALEGEEPAVLRIAEHLLRTGLTDQGVELFEALSRAHPQDPIRLCNLALTYRHLGRLVAAEATYRRAIALSPDDPETWNDFGLMLRASGRWEKAAEAFHRSLALDRRAGEGPAITNLMQMEAVRRGSAGVDPLPWAAVALELRPAAVMLRRLTLDLVLARAQLPDTAGPNR